MGIVPTGSTWQDILSFSFCLNIFTRSFFDMLLYGFISRIHISVMSTCLSRCSILPNFTSRSLSLLNFSFAGSNFACERISKNDEGFSFSFHLFSSSVWRSLTWAEKVWTLDSNVTNRNWSSVITSSKCQSVLKASIIVRSRTQYMLWYDMIWYAFLVSAAVGSSTCILSFRFTNWSWSFLSFITPLH